MSLKNKLLILILSICGLFLFYTLTVLEIQNVCLNEPLQTKSTPNLFDYISDYISESNNALATKDVISTGMYTDANFQNFSVVFEIPPDNELIKNAWEKGQAYIAFESMLQKTKEWIVNNKYLVSLYYYSDEEESQQITIYQKEWVGCDNVISCVQLIPVDAKNKPIYIKYESKLGSLFFLVNGNDIRFLDNYLTIQNSDDYN